MKIRNLAFCGVMASILGVSGAYAANDATIIASKAYVDAKDNLKQDVSNIVTETWANSTADHGSTTKYPSMKTLKDVRDGLETSITNNVTNNTYSTDFVSTSEGATNITVTDVTATDEAKLATTGIVESGFDAVHTAIGNMDHATGTASTNASSAVTAVSQSDGKVTVTNGTLGITAIDDSAKEIGNIVVSSAADTKVPTVGGVQKGILYWQASNDQTGKNAYNSENPIDKTALERGKDWNSGTTSTFTGAAENNKFVGDMDAYIPTVAAVEQRVKAAESNASSNLTNAADTAASATWNANDNTLTIVEGDNPGNKTNKLATSAQVNTSVSALKSYADNKVSGLDYTDGHNGGQAVTKVDEANGVITVTHAALEYEKAMANALKDVNNRGQNQTCNKGNPCVLTYLGTDDNGGLNFRWTQMDTDGIAASVQGS